MEVVLRQPTETPQIIKHWLGADMPLMSGYSRAGFALTGSTNYLIGNGTQQQNCRSYSFPKETSPASCFICLTPFDVPPNKLAGKNDPNKKEQKLNVGRTLIQSKCQISDYNH